MKDRRMYEDPRHTLPAGKKQIIRHNKENPKDEIGLPEDVRVTHSGESNPHDG